MDTLPKGFSVETLNNQFQLSVKWYSTDMVLVFVVLALIWNGMLAYRLVLITQAQDWTTLNQLIYIPLALVGLGLIYVTLAWSFNRTVIVVDAEMLQLRHGPLPWIGNQQVEATDIEKVYVNPVRRESRFGGYQVYEVRVTTKPGQSLRLLEFETVKPAQYIQQQLTGHLNLR